MNDKRKEEILDAENALRDFMMAHKDVAEARLSTEAWQGIMVTMALDVATSGLSQDEALSTLLAMGWIAGFYHDDPELQEIMEEFPSGEDVRDFWLEKAQDVVDDLMKRPGE